ncbi:MAG TPA: hypothetical protein VMJ10_18470 [Kofleriaceae bacterium]|nr:hypothetical protein [Kofleriaceae bacterium]
MRTWIWRAILVVAVCACGPSKHSGGGGGTDGGSNNLPHTLTGITVSPTNPIVQLDLNATGAQGFAVTANYEDNTTEDVTAMATFTVANPAVGTMSGATLSIPSFASATAVVSKITANALGLTGVAQITVVAYRKTGPQQDFFFILPYNDPAGQQMKPLDFSTAIPALDVFFIMDTTGSMTGEINNLKTELNSTVIPGIQAAVANSEFGVGYHDDFPVDTYGMSPDQPFKLVQAITNSVSAVTTGVNSLTLGNGYDEPEAGIEAIYQAATGDGLAGPSPTSVAANHTGVGGVGFRTGTMPVIVPISDADSHRIAPDPGNCNDQNPDYYGADVAAYAHSLPQTETALANICARVVGIAPIGNASCSAVPYYTALATSTGARVPPAAWDIGTRPAGCASNQCCTGQNGAGQATDAQGLCPLVFLASTNGTGVSTNIVTGIQMLTRFATFDVTDTVMGVGTDINGNPLPTGYTTASFIKAVMPATYQVPPPPPTIPPPTFDATTFHGVTPGTTVGFNVDAFNDFVPVTNDAQIFQATIQVLAGGCTPLDQRTVLILVPPNPIVVQ